MILAGTLAPAAAAAGPPPRITSLDGPDGFVRLRVSASPGAKVVVGERDGTVTTTIARVTLPRGRTVLDRAARWRCARRDRVFVVSATLPDGSIATDEVRVRTPSCRTRMAIRVPAVSAAGDVLTLRLRDRWVSGGLTTKVCMIPPGGLTGCRRTTLRGEHRPIALRVRARRVGRWTVRATSSAGQRSVRSFRVRPRRGELRLLTIGDSEMQGFDRFLAGTLRSRGTRVQLRSDARPSTGLSNIWFFDWPPQARRLAHEFHPDVSVVFLGANDGFPLPALSGRKTNCCGKAWVHAYARRVGRMMGSMLRRGQGRVYWVLLPVARDRRAARYFRAVNESIRLAASTRRGEVRLLDTNATFAPEGVYRTTVRYRGRVVTVRSPDGYHLSLTGTRIAARLLADAMRADGVV